MDFYIVAETHKNVCSRGISGIALSHNSNYIQSVVQSVVSSCNPLLSICYPVKTRKVSWNEQKHFFV